MDEPVRCSVVVTTYNRSDLLADALRSLVSQQADTPKYEIIVVDNGSTDGTPAVVASFAASSACAVHYEYEPLRGPSNGRNTGIRHAVGSILAFIDDDVRATPGWVAEIVKTFEAHAEVDALAGRILPEWQDAPPKWLTRDHWVGALALQEYGEEPFVIDASHPLAVAAANLAVRRTAIDRIGLFSTGLMRAEDTDLLMRLWQAGGRCLYVPRVLAIAPIDPARMTKAYHRWWHRTNGNWTARLRLAEMIARDGRLLPEPLEGPKFYGIPSHVFREFLTVVSRWMVSIAAGAPARALRHEYRLQFLLGYIRSTFAAHKKIAQPGKWPREAATFAAALLRRKLGRAPAPPPKLQPPAITGAVCSTGTPEARIGPCASRRG